MNKTQQWVISATAAAAFTVAAGCQGQQPSREVPFYPGERPGEVTTYRDLQFDDMPVPIEYVMLRDKSHSFQGSRFRSGVFHYEGRLDGSDAVAFYRNEMPAHGWALQTFDRDMNFVEMRFRKGPEQVILVVRYAPWGSRAELQLDNIEQNDLLLRGELKSKQ